MAPKVGKKRGKNQASARKKTTKKSTKTAKEPEYLKKVDPILMKNINDLTGGRSHLRIFVPLCGKTPDMLWLAEQGHAITGVEASARYITAFFRDSKLQYTMNSRKITADKKANVYVAKGKDITLYNCDIFDFSFEESGGQFDAIWDQSAMPVINAMGAERLKEYTSLMQSCLKPDGRHMVEICKHGANFVTGEMLKSMVGDKSDVRYIGTRMWKYDESEFEEDEEEGGHGDHGHGDHEHGDHDHGDHEHADDDEEVEMFYHVITFKDKGGAGVSRKRTNEQQEEGKKSKQSKTGDKQEQKKKRRK
ncbi:putative thiopurine S-methyltransferase [Oculina patagonica]